MHISHYIWIFPIIFIFHNMEEIVFAKIWLKRNREWLAQEHPVIVKMTTDFSTEGLAFATWEELSLCIVLCWSVYYFDSTALWGIWLGAFIACALHFVMHILQCLYFRRYIPMVITSVIALPPSIFVIWEVMHVFQNNMRGMYLYIVLGMVVVVLNVIWARKLIGIFTRFFKINDMNE